MHFLGKKYENKFMEVAVHLGLLLLPSKVMDAEAACAMWEEANGPYKSQRVILRHLKNSFGRRITVPERYIRELEDGALHPISVEGKEVFFWYKKIDEVVAHRVKLELQFHGKNFAEQCDHVDVVFGGDHGARRFRAVVQVIFRSKNNANVPTSSITLQVGHINAAKDTYEVLEGTVARELNEGLWRIVDKVLVVHFAENHDPVIVFAVEAPAAEERHNNWAMFGIQALISGDLAFFSTILGKPNMSPIWCNWCMLSKQAWSVAGHAPGDRWAIDKIQQIRHNVEVCGMRDDPSNIMGCIKTPLIDAVPIENFILSVLHIIIGIGNTLVDAFYEWIE